MIRHLGLFLLVSLVSLGSSPTENSRQLIHLLNYIGSDYVGAVRNGKVLNTYEYSEQKEFARTLLELASRDEQFKNSEIFQGDLRQLNRLVLEKADPEEIQKTVSRLRDEAFKVSGLPKAPAKWPNIKHGKDIYSKDCAQCHGATGHGDGPSSGGLDPKPTNFFDSKNDFISPFQYFNAIRLGVPGTAMASFSHLSEKETWDLAFFVASIKHEGKAIPKVSSHPWTLEQVASLSNHELLNTIEQSADKKNETLFLARTFNVAEGSQTSLLELTEQNLMASLEAFKAKKFDIAKAKAISAYLDGIEPLEPKLRINNPDFTVKLEQSLSAFRRQIDERVSDPELERESEKIKELLVEAKTVLATKPSSFWLTYSIAVGIFMREALEAALLLITLLGIVRNLKNRKAIYFIHAGWLSAFGVGLICWFFSGWIVGVSGMRREILEGSISLFAVIVLLYFGYWLHRKTEIGKWRSFINEMVQTALDNKRLMGLAVVSFMGVFREAFETVLFLRALLIESPGQEVALGLGVVSSLAVVIFVSSIMINYSARLPLKQLFTLSSVIMLFLAFILIGKSVHAFQEAGILSQTMIGINMRVDALGLFPTLENLVPQLLLVLISLIICGKPRRLVDTKAQAKL